MLLYFSLPRVQQEASVDTLVSAQTLGIFDSLAHTCIGGAFDTVPEVCILLALFNHSKEFYPVVFDEAGKTIRIPSRADLTMIQRTSSCYSVHPFCLRWRPAG